MNSSFQLIHFDEYRQSNINFYLKILSIFKNRLDFFGLKMIKSFKKMNNKMEINLSLFTYKRISELANTK